MRINSKDLKKKKSFREVYGTEIEILLIILAMLGLAVLAIASVYLFAFLCERYGPAHTIIGLLVITQGLVIIRFVTYCIGKRKLAYIPLTVEECDELGIENLYDMFVFLNKFLRIRRTSTDCYDLYEEQADEVLDLFRKDGSDIEIKESGSSDLYLITRYEYRDLEWLEENKEELEKITLVEASNGQ